SERHPTRRHPHRRGHAGRRRRAIRGDRPHRGAAMTRRLLLLALLLLAPAGRARAEGHTHQHPDVTFRIDQALLEAPAMREAVTKAVKGKIRGLHIGFKEDGLHIGGKYVVPIIGGLDSEAVVGFVWIGPDAFDLRVHKITVFAIDITSTVLEIV